MLNKNTEMRVMHIMSGPAKFHVPLAGPEHQANLNIFCTARIFNARNTKFRILAYFWTLNKILQSISLSFGSAGYLVQKRRGQPNSVKLFL